MREFINIVETTLNENDLRALNVRYIDLDAAIEHFDLPIDEYSKRDILSMLSNVKKEFIDMTKGQSSVQVYRGIQVDREWNIYDQPLGRSWSYTIDGAMKASGLQYFTGSDDVMGVLISGHVPINNVDWGTTVAVAAFSDSETEIVVDGQVFVDQVVEADRRGVGTKALISPQEYLDAQ